MAFSGPGLNYHTDAGEARKLGFPDIVVQGMWSVCLIAEMMTQRFGLGFMAGGKFDLRLVNVLWAEEESAPHGRILARHREGDSDACRSRSMDRKGGWHQNHRRHRQRLGTVKGGQSINLDQARFSS